MTTERKPRPKGRPAHTHRMIFDIDNELYEAFNEACQADERTMSSAVRKLLREYVKKRSKEI